MRVVLEFFKFYSQNLLFAFIVILAVVVSIPIFTYLYFAKDLVAKERIMNHKDVGVTLLDRYNEPFFTFYKAKKKTFVPFSEIPLHTQRALIATEDKDFYIHPGFSTKAIIRSFYLNLGEKDITYGGSTISQQLVKNALLTSEKSFLRKYQEIVLAEEIERRFTKREILEMYLSSVYFGEGAYGIEEAAETYFGKKARDLTLSESAVLIGLLPAPSKYSPISGNKYLAKSKQKHVLKSMLEAGYITRKQFLEAEKEELKINYSSGINSKAPHFALFVMKKLVEKYGEEKISRSGFIVKTTIDLNWQEIAEKTVSEQVENLKFNNVTNGAAVVIDPKTGEIKAMVGSKNWYDEKFGKVNMAVTPRQVGSSFKPIVYITALEKNLITPSTILKDQPTTFGNNYSPQNYDRKFRGNVTVRQALANSLNVPSVEVMSKVGLIDSMEMAQRLGITTLKDPTQYGLSLVLGAGEIPLHELTAAYGVIANSGIANDPTAILQINDKFGNTIYKYNPKQERVLDERRSFQISSILADSGARSEVFGNVLNISRTAAVKTGTTENYKDSLTVGYTPSLVVGVWVGNNDNAPMDNIAGSLGAAPIWKNLMEKFLENTPVEGFVVPPGVVSISVCKGSGLRLKQASSSGITEYFIEGTEPSGYCILPKPSEKDSGSGSKEETNNN